MATPPQRIIKTQNVELHRLISNEGQIPGLPKNPRTIKKRKFEQLVNSLREDPEMLHLRELIVFPIDEGARFIVIGGNMRLMALIELQAVFAPCKILDPSTPIEKLRAIAIKDNVPYGEHDWDILANEWDLDQLVSWGLDVPMEQEPVAVSFQASPKHKVTVECDSESDKIDLMQRLTSEGYKVR